MNFLYLLHAVTGPVQDHRYQALDWALAHQKSLHGTTFIYPNDRISESGIPVQSSFLKRVPRRVFLDPYLHGTDEVPLISGSQFGVFDGFPFDEPIVVGIIGKSLLSGTVSGLSIAVIQRGRGCLASHGSGANPHSLRKKLLGGGSRAYSLHR